MDERALIPLIERSPKEIKKAKDLVLEAVAAELSTSAALRYAGISKEDFDDICMKDARFKELAENARGLVTINAVLNVTRSIMDGNVKNSKWWLERTTDEFSTRQTVTFEGQPILVPVAEKEKEIESILADFDVLEDE